MFSRRICIVASVIAFTDTACATDIPFFGSAEVMAGNFLATQGGAARMAAGSLAGAIERHASSGQPLGGAYALQIGENITAMNVTKVATGMVGGGGPAGFLAREAIGLAAGSLSRTAFNEIADYKTEPAYSSIGGLQAKLADLKSINGMKDGIQQYDLLDRDFNPPEQRRQQPPARRLPRYDSPLDPNDELIGRVPDSRNDTSDIGRDFLDAFTGGGPMPTGRSGCRGVDYTTPNPRSCSGY